SPEHRGPSLGSRRRPSLDTAAECSGNSGDESAAPTGAVMKMKAMPRLLGAVGGVALLLAMMTVPATAQTHATARLRVAHFSPDTPGVDVYLDGKRAVSNLGFRGDRLLVGCQR